MCVILALGFEGVPAFGDPLWGLCVLQDFLLHSCVDAELSARAGFLSFVLIAHSKDCSVVLICLMQV